MPCQADGARRSSWSASPTPSLLVRVGADAVAGGAAGGVGDAAEGLDRRPVLIRDLALVGSDAG